LRSSEAISCETRRQKVSSHMSIQLSTAQKTNLASHPRKCLGGNIPRCDASAQARVVLIFEVNEQHPYFGFVRRCSPLAILVYCFFYRASTLQYEVGCCVLCKRCKRQDHSRGRNLRKPDSSAKAS
jgi:hypothetical protein